MQHQLPRPAPQSSSRFQLSRGAIRDERWRERMQSNQSRNQSQTPAQPNSTFIQTSKDAEPARRPSMGIRPAPPRPPGGLMISLDSPLLSPRTRAKIIAATTGQLALGDFQPQPVSRPAPAPTHIPAPLPQQDHRAAMQKDETIAIRQLPPVAHAQHRTMDYSPATGLSQSGRITLPPIRSTPPLAGLPRDSSPRMAMLKSHARSSFSVATTSNDTHRPSVVLNDRAYRSPSISSVNTHLVRRMSMDSKPVLPAALSERVLTVPRDLPPSSLAPVALPKITAGRASTPPQVAPVIDPALEGYNEWRATQEAALSAAREAYVAELEQEKRQKRTENRKHERELERERLRQANLLQERESAGNRKMDQAKPELAWSGQGAPGVSKPEKDAAPSEQEKRRRRKIQYQVFVHARWKDCTAILTSWSNLEKHIHRAHMQPADQDQQGKPALCKWNNCGKVYEDQDRLYRHCLVEHMGEFCARCPFQCRYEGPDFAQLMAHIERRHSHCTPADFTPAVPRASPPTDTHTPPPLPRYVQIQPFSEEEGEPDQRSSDHPTRSTTVVGARTNGRTEKLVQRNCMSRSTPERYDQANTDDRSWLEARVAGEVVGEIVRAARQSAAAAKPPIGEGPKTLEPYGTDMDTESLKNLAKEVRKRIKAGDHPSVPRRSISLGTPDQPPRFFLENRSPRPCKRTVDSSDTEAHSRTQSGSPSKQARLSLGLSPRPRPSPLPLSVSNRRHLSAPQHTRSRSENSLQLSIVHTQPDDSRKHTQTEVESFKALFANVDLTPQKSEDERTSDMGRAASTGLLTRRAPIQLPAPADALSRPSLSPIGPSRQHTLQVPVSPRSAKPAVQRLILRAPTAARATSQIDDKRTLSNINSVQSAGREPASELVDGSEPAEGKTIGKVPEVVRMKEEAK